MKIKNLYFQFKLVISAIIFVGLAWSNELRAETYDVIVYSGVPCGIASAITAKREGASVLLIEPTKHVGGLSTSGINTAESEHMLKWTIGGFADEFYRELGKHYQTNKPEYYFESSVAEKVYLQMLKEAGVKTVYGSGIKKLLMDKNVIKSIELSNGEVHEARIFIDASYEGDLYAKAGVKYAIGRESQAEFGEEAAGVRFDKTTRKARTVDEQGNLLPGISGWVKDLSEGEAHPATMNYNFRLTMAKEEKYKKPIPQAKEYNPQRYAILAGWFKDQAEKNKTVKLTEILDFYARRNGKYELNNKQSAIFSVGHFGGQFNYSDASEEERKKIFDDHWNYTLGLLYFLANDPGVPENVRKEMQSWGVHSEEFKDNNNLPYQLYVREARRMRGQYVMKQQDVQTERRKDDSIGMSSHFIDSHHVQRLAVNEQEFLNEGRIWRMGYAYQIPYRALLPKQEECINLIVPCAASYSHVAFCTLRLESVWMITGHAAGVAAGMSIQEKKFPSEIKVLALQEKLKTQGQVIDFIPGMPEKCEHLNGPPEF